MDHITLDSETNFKVRRIPGKIFNKINTTYNKYFNVVIYKTFRLKTVYITIYGTPNSKK